MDAGHGHDMVTIFIHLNGATEQVTSIDRAWLNPAAAVTLWVDLAAPSIPESLILSETFAFHSLAVEDAMSARQYPKVEAYDGYLYVILHGIESKAADHSFATHDVRNSLPTALIVVIALLGLGALTAGGLKARRIVLSRRQA